MARKLQTRVVLQHEKSSLYFQGINRWTADLNEAMDFGEIRLAHKFCRTIEQTELCIVMIFGDDRQLDVRLRAWQ
ncbi:MAG: hypothetical protein JWR19_1852 [Pedosphaera sp.]|jgi:hypothetical protein|nr:hypothetical protein [Pedosphaera sp.]